MYVLLAGDEQCSALGSHGNLALLSNSANLSPMPTEWEALPVVGGVTAFLEGVPRKLDLDAAGPDNPDLSEPNPRLAKLKAQSEQDLDRRTRYSNNDSIDHVDGLGGRNIRFATQWANFNIRSARVA
ncbi:MAG: hypothetical protein ACT4OM_04475 [Actinomycetota bacterium]